MPFIGVPFTILAESGIHESVRFGSGPEAVVKFKVKWGDRYNFINGTTGKATGGSKSSIVRASPLQYPPSPNLYAVDADIDDMGKLSSDGAGWANYDYAVITVTFRPLTFGFDTSTTTDPSGQPWTTTTFDYSADFITTPDSVFSFGTPGAIGTTPSNKKPTGAPVGIIVPQVAITMKRFWVPYLPVSEILTLLNTPLNNAPFILGNFTCPPETLLFMGGPSQHDEDTLGDAVQTIEYKFIYRSVPWNKFLHPDGMSGWQYIYDNNSQKPYAVGDFTTLP